MHDLEAFLRKSVSREDMISPRVPAQSTYSIQWKSVVHMLDKMSLLDDAVQKTTGQEFSLSNHRLVRPYLGSVQVDNIFLLSSPVYPQKSCSEKRIYRSAQPKMWPKSNLGKEFVWFRERRIRGWGSGTWESCVTQTQPGKPSLSIILPHILKTHIFSFQLWPKFCRVNLPFQLSSPTS